MKQLEFSSYYDKVLGGWLGKCIGGACGALSENNKNILHYTIENVFPEVIPPNDDLDLQILWLQEGLEKKGVGITTEDFGKLFAKHNICLANEYAVAIRNISLGIYPPVSGLFDNSYFLNSMGCPIRSEIWALVAPGSFSTVKYYSRMDGSVDHGEESINGEIFNAVMESAAFFESDLETLVDTALEEIPQDGLQYQSISFALECYRRKLEWATARNQLVRRYGSMDASYSVVNLGLTILALLYGQGDFAQTLLYAVNGGYDTDCTAATALSILGIIIGAENIPEFWKNKIGSELVVGTVDIQCRYPTIDSLAKATCEAGLSFEKAGLLDVELVNVPSSFKPSLPEIESDGVEIQIEYSGAPVIGIGEQTQVLIKLKNITDSPLSGKMELKGPEYLSLSFTGMELNLLPDQEAAFPLSVQADSRLKQLPMENFFTVSFAGFSKIFGLMGAMRMKLFGPYWDNYDTTVYPEDPYHEKTQRFPNGDGDVHAMFNGFVNVEREYIPEDFSQWPEDFQWVNIHGSEFDIEEKIGYRGPACVYLVHDFYLDKDFSQGDFHFGCNAPTKIWINGKMVLHNTHHYAWTIFNCNAPAPLKKGHNQIIYKLTRTDAFHFSAFCRDWNDKARFIYSFVSSEE